MSLQTGLGDGLIVGTTDVSGDIGSLQKITIAQKSLDVTGINKFAHERVIGKLDGAIDFTAWFNPTANAEHTVLKALPIADVQVTYLRGTAVGSSAASCVAKQVNYDPKRGADGSLSFTVNTQSNAFGLEWGLQLTPGIRTDTVLTNGAAVDNTASTAFGLQAYLHVTAFIGTSVTLLLQDSPDNITFGGVTGGSFGAVSAVGTQRIATSTGQTVNRYLRVITGAGTFTSVSFVVSVVRNISLPGVI